VATVGEPGFATNLIWWDTGRDARTRTEWTDAGSGLDKYADPAVSPDLTRFAFHAPQDAAGVDFIAVSEAAADGTPTREVGGDDEDFSVGCLAFTPDGGTLLAGVTGADGPQIARWDTARLFTGGLQAATVAEDDPIDLRSHRPTCLACSTDGTRLAVGTKSERVLIFDLRTGERLWALTRKPQGTRTRSVRGLTFAPDGRTLLARVGTIGTVWDVTTGKAVVDINPPGKLTDIAFAPDGRTIAGTTAAGTVTVWDAGTFAERQRLDWKLGSLHAIAFSPDGLTCAAGADRGRVVIWDVDE
ncbi:MAG: WD40 repeat domain-containing protein, partial [Fimbriiglobus sp.]